MNKLKFKPTTTKHNNNTNNNNQLTPELNHHLILSRRSRALAQALPTQARKSNSSSQTATNSQTNPQTKPQTNPQTSPAFTIIEVVLVLAIAGLIFLMVFIALPALQRNQRDTQRKNDMATFASELNNYAANNRGKYPDVSGYSSNAVTSTHAPELYNFAKSYLNWPGAWYVANENESFVDPSIGGGYTIAVFGGMNSVSYDYAAARPYIIYYANANQRCPRSGEDPKTGVASTGSIMLYQGLESGGVNCVDVR